MNSLKTFHKAGTLVLMSLFLFNFSAAQALSPRNANYDIKVKLLPEEKLLEATETVRWRNITNSPTDEVQFHLYYNAFSHPKTTFMLESGGQLRGDRFSPKKMGYIKINSISMGETDMTDQLDFIRPDDDNPNDSTVIRLKLPEPVAPGEEIELNLTFTAKSPRVFARSGYATVSDRDMTFFMVGQWFPKVGVLEDDGWNCHQYHGSTEFFSDFGVYNVSISVPDEYVVGSSGKLVSSESDSTYRTDTYRAEDVHDFSWTAYPGFEVLEDKLGHTDIRLLYNPEEADLVEEQMDYFKRGMDIANKKIGIYPYSTLTIVNPPAGARGAAGMEYPTLITAGVIPGIPSEMSFKFSHVTIHEYGHQYFYGMVASNEFEHSWMDEGFTTFFTDFILDELYPSMLPESFPVLESKLFSRMGYIAQPKYFTMLDTMYMQRRGGTYGINAYNRPATLLTTLRQMLGEEEFLHFLSSYFEQWKFKHPYPQDMFDVLQATTKKDLSWFIDDYMKNEKAIDYRVRRVRTKEVKVEEDNFYPLPFVEQIDSVDFSDTTGTFYSTYIAITNEEDGRFPLEVQITFADSSTMDLSKYFCGMKGRKFQDLEIVTNKEVTMVKIDPEGKNYMDADWTNNSWVKKNNPPASKYVDFMKHLSATLIQIVAGI